MAVALVAALLFNVLRRLRDREVEGDDSDLLRRVEVNLCLYLTAGVTFCFSATGSWKSLVPAGGLLGQFVGLAVGGVQVDGQRSAAGTASSRPGPRQQFTAHPVQLADVATWPHRKLRRKVPKVDGAFTV